MSPGKVLEKFWKFVSEKGYEPCIMLLDLLTIDPHTPTPEPVSYDKKDGQWYTHDGVDVKDTQQRKGKKALLEVAVAVAVVVAVAVIV